MMHFGIPILAFDSKFNSYTTSEKALYFNSVDELVNLLSQYDPTKMGDMGNEMQNLGRSKYTWKKISRSYFELFR